MFSACGDVPLNQQFAKRVPGIPEGAGMHPKEISGIEITEF
jgi:hypothetical protein